MKSVKNSKDMSIFTACQRSNVFTGGCLSVSQSVRREIPM